MVETHIFNNSQLQNFWNENHPEKRTEGHGQDNKGSLNPLDIPLDEDEIRLIYAYTNGIRKA